MLTCNLQWYTQQSFTQRSGQNKRIFGEIQIISRQLIKKFHFLQEKRKCDIGIAIGQFAANVGWPPLSDEIPLLGFDDVEFKFY